MILNFLQQALSCSESTLIRLELSRFYCCLMFSACSVPVSFVSHVIVILAEVKQLMQSVKASLKSFVNLFGKNVLMEYFLTKIAYLQLETFWQVIFPCMKYMGKTCKKLWGGCFFLMRCVKPAIKNFY